MCHLTAGDSEPLNAGEELVERVRVGESGVRADLPLVDHDRVELEGDRVEVLEDPPEPVQVKFWWKAPTGVGT